MKPTFRKTRLLQANKVDPADRTVSGTVRHLTFRNDQNGYFVARLAVAGVSKEITVVGYAPAISKGEALEAEGRWEVSKYGPQFKAEHVKVSAPVDEDGLIKYLARQLPGVGLTQATALVNAFGADVLSVIEKKPHRLSEVHGIGKKRIKSIMDAWRKLREERGEDAEAMAWLMGLGLSMAAARKVFELHRGSTRRKVSRNPYELAEVIEGIGFRRADAIARKLGLSQSNPYRVRAALLHVLQTATSTGSCGLPRNQLIEGTKRRNGTTAFTGARELLGFANTAERTALIEQELEFLRSEGKVVLDQAHGETCVFLKSIHEAERAIAEHLRKRIAQPARLIEDLDAAIRAAEAECQIVLEGTQRQAVASALKENIAVITGGPGTGKTTLTRVIVTMLEQQGKGVLVCAPTGKAAKRASEAIGTPAATVHRTLEWKSNGPQFNRERPLCCDALILDEMSMVDVHLFNAVLNALPPKAKLILIGDADQLPSVGPGKVLTDLIASGRVPTTRLTQVFRQAEQSLIIRNAHRVNQGYAPLSGREEDADFGFFHYDTPEEAQRALLKAARDIWKHGFDPIRETQVLVPMRKGMLGVDTLNQELQRLLNPTPAAEMPFQGGKIGVGDKVIQVRNNYNKEVFNGEIGYVIDVDAPARTLVVDFDGHATTYTPKELDELRLAYCFTIHRAQGSEFPVVLMGLANNHYVMLKRNLLYTGITRARKLMLIYGHAQAAVMAAKNSQIEERYSKLRERLIELPPGAAAAA